MSARASRPAARCAPAVRALRRACRSGRQRGGARRKSARLPTIDRATARRRSRTAGTRRRSGILTRTGRTGTHSTWQRSRPGGTLTDNRRGHPIAADPPASRAATSSGSICSRSPIFIRRAEVRRRGTKGLTAERSGPPDASWTAPGSLEAVTSGKAGGSWYRGSRIALNCGNCACRESCPRRRPAELLSQRPAVMISGQVPPVRVPPDHPASSKRAAVPAQGSEKNAEILIPRHQLTVLQPHQPCRRPKLTWADQALLATLLSVIPKARRGGCGCWSLRARSCAGTATSSSAALRRPVYARQDRPPGAPPEHQGTGPPADACGQTSPVMGVLAPDGWVRDFGVIGIPAARVRQAGKIAAQPGPGMSACQAWGAGEKMGLYWGGQMPPIISRGFRGRRGDAPPGRVPPGQYVTRDFPVLSAGPTPHTPLDRWSFSSWAR